MFIFNTFERVILLIESLLIFKLINKKKEVNFLEKELLALTEPLNQNIKELSFFGFQFYI